MSIAQTNTLPLSAAPDSTGKPLRIALWVAQGVVAAMFFMSGSMKLATPIAELAAMMPWTGQVSPVFVRFIGLVDLAGGIGILLPALTRIQPRLTVLAALGCVVLQVLAFGFHAYRGEFAVLPMNVVLFALSAFVLWGRSKKAPILPRA
ncbi:MAG TPA: DoxX family protein [Microvirga sp.]|jgi:uncharacterized membrane protein YphA (DoxX/SURF4 family)